MREEEIEKLRGVVRDCVSRYLLHRCLHQRLRRHLASPLPQRLQDRPPRSPFPLPRRQVPRNPQNHLYFLTAKKERKKRRKNLAESESEKEASERMREGRNRETPRSDSRLRKQAPLLLRCLLRRQGRRLHQRPPLPLPPWLYHGLLLVAITIVSRSITSPAVTSVKNEELKEWDQCLIAYQCWGRPKWMMMEIFLTRRTLMPCTWIKIMKIMIVRPIYLLQYAS